MWWQICHLTELPLRNNGIPRQEAEKLCLIQKKTLLNYVVQNISEVIVDVSFSALLVEEFVSTIKTLHWWLNPDV